MPGNDKVPSVVHETLRSPGRSLDTASRASFERRFGHDFSSVKIHADESAAASAEAVNALAYTSGSHIVFGRGQYSPSTDSGQNLMAHELAHIIQQRGMTSMPEKIAPPSDPLEQAADHTANRVMRTATFHERKDPGIAQSTPTLYRRVAGVNCTAGSSGAPADPRGELEKADAIAIKLSTQVGAGLAADSKAVLGGIPATPSATLQAYQAHFGLPTASGTGFLNRITGTVQTTQEKALSEELAIVSKRFLGVARLLTQGLSYNCPGTGPLKLVGCQPGTCPGNFAFSCPGNSLVALCEDFWTVFGDGARGQTLIHESMHITLGNIGVGAILDATTKGPGRNFNIANCYEAVVSDISGVDSRAECPAVGA